MSRPQLPDDLGYSTSIFVSAREVDECYSFDQIEEMIDTKMARAKISLFELVKLQVLKGCGVTEAQL